MRRSSSRNNSSVHSRTFNYQRPAISKLTKLVSFGGARFALLFSLVAIMAAVSYTTSSSSSRLTRSAATSSVVTAKSASASRLTHTMRKRLSAFTKTMAQADEDVHQVGRLNIERHGHTAVQLADGRILIIGGENEKETVKESEIFDSGSRSFSLSARLRVARTNHTATRLEDGRVLVIGGRNKNGLLSSTEIFDPATDSFSRGPRLNHARAGHTATALANGNILIAGGDADGSAEIFDVASCRFAPIISHLSAARSNHSAVRLQSGKVLIAGGQMTDGSGVSSAEIFDPETMSFTATRSDMQVARVRPLLRVLENGNVQIIGGDRDRTMEMFNAEGQYFTARAHVLSDSGSLAEVLKSPSRVGIIQTSGESLFAIESVAGAVSTDLLDRDGYSIIDLGSAGGAIITGGITSSGDVTASAVTLDSSSATVVTDKTDYSPGEIVHITGAGWQAGETVSLRLHRDGFDVETDTLLSAVADAEGNISNSDYVVQESDLGLTFLLTATGQTSARTAQTTFTDAPRVDTVTVSSQSPVLVCPGSNATYTVTVKRGQNNNFTVNFNITGLPAGVTATFSPNSLVFQNGPTPQSQTTTLTLGIPNPLPAGATTFTVEAFRSTLTTDNAFGNGTLTVDTTKPTIALIGANPLTVECHTSFTDPGATASDNCAGNLTSAITVTGSVNANAVGTYTLTYNVSDPSGNAATPVTRTVNVVDTTPPTITLNGANPMTVECHSVFTDPGATASDSCAGSLTITKSGSVDTSTPGNYTITYSAIDPSSNTQTITRTVKVMDTVKPTIALIGDNPMVVAMNGTFNDPGATASDSCGGNLTSQIVRTGSVNSNAVGTYTLTYNVSDPSGNAATPVTRTVKVQYSSSCGHVILPPINPDGSSVFKAGSTVPAKFRVCDANGYSVGTPGVVSMFKLVTMIAGTASTSVNEDVISTTPDPYFRWDETAQQWIFNISTKGMAKNMTYVYLITLNDGSTIQFQFGLK